MMITIRNYEKKDKENFYKILIETSRLPVDTESDIAYLKLLYNDFYREITPESCFVAADEEDKAVGYIICAPDFSRFQRIFRKYYLPKIKKLGLKYYINALMEIAGHSLYSKKYAAHLHINVLPVCQGQGAGSRLVAALKEHLKKEGVEGLMLSCAADNEGAIRFYERNGFQKLKVLFGGCMMGTKI